MYYYCDSGHWCFWLAVCLFSVGVFGLLMLPFALGKLFAPQGIGVFEVLASALLVGELGLEQTIPLVLGFRLVFVVTDITVWAGFRFFKVLQEGEIRVR